MKQHQPRELTPLWVWLALAPMGLGIRGYLSGYFILEKLSAHRSEVILGRSEMPGRKSAGRHWTPAEEKQLQDMLDAGMKVVEVARKLKRTAQAIYARLQRIYRRRRPIT